MLLKASRPNSSATGDSSLSAFAGGGQKSTARPDPVVVCRAPSGHRPHRPPLLAPIRDYVLRFSQPWGSDSLNQHAALNRQTSVVVRPRRNIRSARLAATAAPPHACCIRKAAHQCHGSGPEADQRTVHSTSCCNQGCGRGVTTFRSASPESSLAVAVADHVDVRLADLSAQNPSAVLFSSQSTRAPPRVSIP